MATEVGLRHDSRTGEVTVVRHKTFEPTPLMAVYLDARLNAPLGSTVEEICNTAVPPINLNTARSWNSPSFREWMSTMMTQASQMRLGGIHDAITRKAEGGDVRAAEISMRRFDDQYKTEDSHTHNIFHRYPQFKDTTDEELQGRLGKIGMSAVDAEVIDEQERGEEKAGGLASPE